MNSPAGRLLLLCGDESPCIDDVKKTISTLRLFYNSSSAAPEASSTTSIIPGGARRRRRDAEGIHSNSTSTSSKKNATLVEALMVACQTVRSDPITDSTLIEYLLSEAIKDSNKEHTEDKKILCDCLTQLVRSSKILVLRYMAKKPKVLSSALSSAIFSTPPSSPSLPPADYLWYHSCAKENCPHERLMIINVPYLVKKYSLAFTAIAIEDDFDMMSTMEYILKLDPTVVKDEKDEDLLIERVISRCSPRRRSVFHTLQLYRLLIDLGVEHNIPKAGLMREKFLAEGRYQYSPLHHLLTLAPNVLCLHYLQNRPAPLLAPSDVVNFKLLYPVVQAMKIDMVQYLLNLNIMGIKTMPLLLIPNLFHGSFLRRDPEEITRCESLLRILVEAGINARIGGEFGAGGLLVPFDSMGAFPSFSQNISHTITFNVLNNASSEQATRLQGAQTLALFLTPPSVNQEDNSFRSQQESSDRNLRAYSPAQQSTRRFLLNHHGNILHLLCAEPTFIDGRFLDKVVFGSVDEIFRRHRVPILHSIAQDITIWESMDTLITKFPWCVTVEDSTGCLPIHHAITNNVGWLEGIKTLMELCPTSILKLDCNGRSPLHILIDNGVKTRLRRFSIIALNTLLNIVHREPWIASTIMDSELLLYPFMYAATGGSQHSKMTSHHNEQNSITHTPLRTSTINNSDNRRGTPDSFLHLPNTASFALDACYILLRTCPMLLSQEVREIQNMRANDVRHNFL